MTRPTFASAREFLTSEHFAEKIRTFRRDAGKHLDPAKVECRTAIHHRIWFSATLADSWDPVGRPWKFPPADESITAAVLIDKIQDRVFEELGEEYSGGELKITIDGGNSDQHIGAVSAVIRSRESESEREASRLMERIDRELKRHQEFAQFAPALAKDFAQAYQTMSRGTSRIVTASARMLEALASDAESDDLLAKFTNLAKLVADDDDKQKLDKAGKAGKAIGGKESQKKRIRRRIGADGRIGTEPEPEPEEPTKWELSDGTLVELTDDQIVELFELWAKANPDRARREGKRLVAEGVIKIL